MPAADRPGPECDAVEPPLRPLGILIGVAIVLVTRGRVGGHW